MDRFTNSFEHNNKSYHYYDLKQIFNKYPILRKLPNSLKILLETNIRNINESEQEYILETFLKRENKRQIGFFPNRVVINDKYGISILKELVPLKNRYKNINPKIITDLVIEDSKKNNVDKYAILKTALNKFENFSVISSDSEDFSMINLEYLSTMLSSKLRENDIYLFPETLVGTDNQITMTNALGVLGLKLNELDTKAAILGSPIILEFPKVVGVELFGNISLGVSISDIVESLIAIFKQSDIKDKIIEFHGNGLKNISIEDRVILSNTISEYGALCGYFGVDENSISYIEKTRGADASFIKEYFIKQGMYDNNDLLYDEYIRFNLSAVAPTIIYKKSLERVEVKEVNLKLNSFKKGKVLKDNDIVVANISSNSSLTLLIQACLVAKKACELNVVINRNIDAFFELDSMKVKEYLEKLDLLKYLEHLGFKIVTKSSKVLKNEITLDILNHNLNVVSISSVDEDTLNNKIKSNWIMSPALVLAYSFNGNMNFEITKDTIYKDIGLSDIWPSSNEVNEYLLKIDSYIYQKRYKEIYNGTKFLQDLKENVLDERVLDICEEKDEEFININDAKILAIYDEDIKSEDIVPKGKIEAYSQVGFYLESLGLRPEEFSSFEDRYDNVEVLKRGLFSSNKLKNKIAFPKEGAYTKDFENKEIVTIYEFSQKQKKEKRDLLIISKESFKTTKFDLLAVRGIKLLGVKAVIAKSFDKKFKDYLIKMGILPLVFIDDIDEIFGNEIVSIKTDELRPNLTINIEVKKNDEVKEFRVLIKLDTRLDLLYYKYGGILNYLIKKD